VSPARTEVFSCGDLREQRQKFQIWSAMRLVSSRLVQGVGMCRTAPNVSSSSLEFLVSLRFQSNWFACVSSRVKMRARSSSDANELWE
jgi:hypothetical protein